MEIEVQSVAESEEKGFRPTRRLVETKPGRVRVTISMESHELRLLRESARAYDLGMGRFLMLLFRDWLVDRRPLRLVPPLPRGRDDK